MSPQSLQVSIHIADFALQNYESTPDDNIKQTVQNIPSDFQMQKFKRMLTFPIIPVNAFKKLLFFPLNFSPFE